MKAGIKTFLILQFLLVARAHALEPERAYLKTKDFLERRILKQATLQFASLNLSEIYQGTSLVERINYDQGREANYSGEFTYKLENMSKTLLCRAKANVKKVYDGKQPGTVEVLEKRNDADNNPYYIVAEINRVHCEFVYAH